MLKKYICNRCSKEFVGKQINHKYKFCSHSCVRKGTKFSNNHKRRIGEANKGKHRSEETRRKMSLVKKNIPNKKNQGENNGMYKGGYRILGEKNGMFGKTPWNKGLTKNNDKRILKCSLKKIGKNIWLNKKHPFFGKHHSEVTKERLRTLRLSQIILRKDTSIEIKLQEQLKKLGLFFITHKSILNITQPDIFIEPNICIFVDGCWWHGCEQCFNRNKFPNWILTRQIIDKSITTKLRESGYVVLRFWEHEINNDIEKCMYVIREQLQMDIKNDLKKETKNNDRKYKKISAKGRNNKM